MIVNGKTQPTGWYQLMHTAHKYEELCQIYRMHVIWTPCLRRDMQNRISPLGAWHCCE